MALRNQKTEEQAAQEAAAMAGRAPGGMPGGMPAGGGAPGKGLPDREQAAAGLAQDLGGEGSATAQATASATVETQQPAQQPAPAPATRQTAPPPVSAMGGQIKPLFENLRNNYVVDFGTMPRLKAGQGCIEDGDGEDVGLWAIIEMVSFNSKWTISPGDDKAPKELVKFSMDNVTLDDNSGISVAAYLEDLKRQGYENAAVKEYYEVIGLLLASEKETEHMDGLVSIQLSPQSRKSFENYRMQQSVRHAMGKLNENQAARLGQVAFIAKKEKYGQKNYTKLLAKAPDSVAS